MHTFNVHEFKEVPQNGFLQGQQQQMASWGLVLGRPTVSDGCCTGDVSVGV